MDSYFLVSGRVLSQLAYCREDDILPNLMKSMKNKMPDDAEGFYSKCGDGTELQPFADLYEKGQILTIEERRLLSDLEGK